MIILLKQIGKWFGYIIVFILCFEVALYLAGYSVYQYHDYKVESHPAFPYVPDDTLGIKLRPGTFEITINDGLTYTAAHLNSGRRRIAMRQINSEHEVHFLGCSFTYGYGVNDFETFVSFYQRDNLDKAVFNHSVIGYGSVQHFLQLCKLLETNTNSRRTVNLILSSHHLHRNTLSNSFRRDLRIGFTNSSQIGKDKFSESKFPYVKSLNPTNIAFEPWTSIYSNYPGRSYFRCVNWLQNWFDYLNDVEEHEVDFTFELVKEMGVLCAENGVKLNVLILDESEKMTNLIELLSDTEISFSEIKFDFTNHSYTNYPYDSHPSPLGHQFIYDKIKMILK